MSGLEDREPVKRSPSATDQRSHGLQLTDEGSIFLARAEALVAEHEKRLIWKVGPRGYKQLLDLLGVFGKK
jgi:DNA-binding MarR family transcriptional regulator